MSSSKAFPGVRRFIAALGLSSFLSRTGKRRKRERAAMNRRTPERPLHYPQARRDPPGGRAMRDDPPRHRRNLGKVHRRGKGEKLSRLAAWAKREGILWVECMGWRSGPTSRGPSGPAARERR